MPRGQHSMRGGNTTPASIVGKKNVYSLEYVTLFLLIILFFMVAYLYYVNFAKQPADSTNSLYLVNNGVSLANRDPLSDPYFPPVKYADSARSIFPDSARTIFPDAPPLSRSFTSGGDIRGPILMPGVGAIPTRPFSRDYSQVGILTRDHSRDAKFDSDKLILPLMGRQVDTGRSKWQYYSMSNSGNLNTKLPIRIRGKNCSGEYGCDEVMDGDEIYVQGYNDVFRATIYETGSFAYRPF